MNNEMLNYLANLENSSSGGGGGEGGGVTPAQLAAGLATKQNKVTEVTVATDGAVNQALEAGKWYHFTGALTGLTITLTAPASGELAQYHFDFTSGATAPTLTMPDSVVMPEGFSVEANKRYEVDVLNNYGVAQSWEVRA